MRNKIFGSFALVGVLLSSGFGADTNVFGHIGGTFNKGFSNGNKAFDYSNGEYKNADYAGLTAQLGLDVGFGNLHIGAAGWGGYGFYGSPKDYTGTGYTYGEARYTKKYGDLSDLYVKYDGEIELAVGRFDTEFLKSDWIAGHTQGVAAKWDSKYFGVWATWVNDYATYGYKPNRFGSEISSFDRYSSSFNHFNIGNRDLFAGGINVDLGFLKIDPFVHYWLGGYGYYNDETNVSSHSMIQAGTKVALEFGNDASIKSITSGRFLWQNIIGVNSDDTFLFWADEEVRFKNMVKVGAGWYSVGKNNGIYAINDRSRFYGTTYLTPSKSSYFGQNVSSWYVFAGFESEIVNFDLLYANGDYNEFSAILSWNVFKAKNDLALDIGGGYVSNGFQSKAIQQNNAVVFAKLSF